MVHKFTKRPRTHQEGMSVGFRFGIYLTVKNGKVNTLRREQREREREREKQIPFG